MYVYARTYMYPWRVPIDENVRLEKKKIHKKDEISRWKIRLIKTNACFIVNSFNFTLKTAFRKKLSCFEAKLIEQLKKKKKKMQMVNA